MNKLSKGLVFGFLTLALVVGVGAVSANAALTFSALTLASDGALTLTGAAASNVDIATTTSTGDITIGGAQTAANTIILGGGTSTGNINIGGTVLGQTINIGNLGGAKTVNIGLATSTATLNLAAGTGRVNITGQIKTVQNGTAIAVAAETGGAGVSVLSTGSTDTAGGVTSSVTAHTAVNLTFGETYTNTPFCVVTPGNAAASAITAAGYFATATATTLSITTASDTTAALWYYHCFAR